MIIDPSDCFNTRRSIIYWHVQYGNILTKKLLSSFVPVNTSAVKVDRMITPTFGHFVNLQGPVAIVTRRTW